ncbi:hypothetical protein GCM10023185_37410 [Hymenobacter saemangeumensis]|uniref:STAS/SEC14 domain-containing protein n=1 Tax=Hymenobacter saemangeumensis TaxID=1084522 RepID=A0ABP8IR61_9BACT
MADLGLEIATRPDLPAVVARWQREISVGELQAGYQAILAAADGCRCGRWLLDLRRRNELTTPEIDAWMHTVFLPQLIRRYEAPARLAFLVSPLRVAQAPPSNSTALDAAAAEGVQSAIFTNEAEAYRWLAQ